MFKTSQFDLSLLIAICLLACEFGGKSLLILSQAIIYIWFIDYFK